MDKNKTISDTPQDEDLSRRRFVRGFLIAPAAAAVLQACSRSTGVASTTPASTAAPTAVGSTAAVATAAPTTTAAASTAAPGTATPSVAWASGGTDLISVAYPDSSIFASANTCTISLTGATTEGPCYFASDTTEDISEGKTGLPMQLCVQLVDDACVPLSGYTLEVWSCDNRGIYSGDTAQSTDSERFAGSFCTADDAEAVASTYLRGQATTDAEGRANFLTIFPGWYRGRTIHIHFAVTDPGGTTRVISQWCFTDEFAENICTTHELYSDRGVQDTPLAGGTDSVFPADSYEEYLLSLEQNADGTLLGYGTIRIDPTAVASNPGGPMGPPPGEGGDRPPGPPPGEGGERPDGPPPGEDAESATGAEV